MMEIILPVISIAAFVMSTTTWVITFWKQRKNIKISLSTDILEPYSYVSELIGKSVDGDENNFSGLKINLTVPWLFENCSTNPISIVKLSATSLSGKTFNAAVIREFVNHKTRKMIDTDTIYEFFVESANFPINISSLCSAHEYVSFHIPYDFYETFSFITVHTNRGKVKITDPDIISTHDVLAQKAIQAYKNNPLQ